MLRRDFLRAMAGLALSGRAVAAAGFEKQQLDPGIFQDFGPDFVWGASTSSYQIEGAVAVDGRAPSIWDVFSHTPGRTRNGETGDVAADHYHRSSEDVALLADGGFGAYRFSTAWPRIVPAGRGAINQRGLDFYDRLVDQLAEHGIAPWICLYHWDLPQALQERGGWRNRDIGFWFADYARAVAHRLGDRVKHWAMLNEAVVHAMIGHGFGDHAPGLRGADNFAAALHHQNLAQGMAIQALRAERQDCKLGTVMCLEPIQPVSEQDRDRQAAQRFDAIWNRAALDPLFKGAYPATLSDLFTPWIKPTDLATIRQPVDFLGLNYYSRLHIKHDAESPFGATFGPPPENSRFTAMAWSIEPDGLYQQLIELRDHYGNPAVFVAENGAAFDDVIDADGTIHDTGRIAYLREHLVAARRALHDGVALRGYFVWSLLDNFEWTEGTSKRFGIIHVDFKTLKRTPKASYAWFAEGLKRRRTVMPIARSGVRP